MAGSDRIDLSKPLYDQSTFIGRVRHFAFVTDPTTVFSSDKQLEDAKQLVLQYKEGREPKGVTKDQLIYAKKLYDSSFHPDTGEKQNIFGRMSFQVPGGMLLTGAMLQFYKTSGQVIFWQWANQSFNALVNYTNRNAKSPLTTTQLGVAYVSATASALGAALGCKAYLAKRASPLLQTILSLINSYTRSLVSATASALGAALGCKAYLAKRASPLLQRYVPFVAVAAANCVNIPLMRQGELLSGIVVTDEEGNKLTESKIAAVKGISQVVFSRIFMALPGMTILPIIFENLEKKDWMKRIPKLHAPMQVLGSGLFLIFMVPIACGIFPQTCSIKSSTLQRYEPKSFEQLSKRTKNIPERLYFNKGL